MDVAAAEKSARLVQLCDTFHIPMVVLMDDPGFLVGPMSEEQGIERAGSRLVHAIAHSTMPWISFICRQSYGLAGSLQYRPGPHLYRRYAWVSGHWGSMHIEGGTSAAFRRVIESAPDPGGEAAGARGDLPAHLLAVPDCGSERARSDRPAGDARAAVRLRRHGSGSDQDAARSGFGADLPAVGAPFFWALRSGRCSALTSGATTP